MQRKDIIKKEFQMLVAKINELSKKLSIDVVIGICGNNLDEDIDLGGWYETPGAEGFIQNKIGSPNDAISRLQATVIKNMSVCVDGSLSDKTTRASPISTRRTTLDSIDIRNLMTPESTAGEAVDAGVESTSDKEGQNWQEIIHSGSHRVNVIKKGINRGLNALGAVTPRHVLRWHALAPLYAQRGIYITNWPVGVHFPGESSPRGGGNRCGIRALPVAEIESLAAAFEDPNECPVFHRYKDPNKILGKPPSTILFSTTANFFCLRVDLQEGKLPFITERAPPASSMQKRGRRMFYSKSRKAFRFDERGEPRNESGTPVLHSRSKKRSGDVLQVPNRAKKAKPHERKAYFDPRSSTETYYTPTEDISRSSSIEVEGPSIASDVSSAASRSGSDFNMADLFD